MKVELSSKYPVLAILFVIDWIGILSCFRSLELSIVLGLFDVFTTVISHRGQIFAGKGRL